MHECFEFAELREFELDLAGDFFHRLGLRRGTNAGDRVADVDRRTDAFVKEVRLKEDLPVRDGDHVGRDVGGDVVFLCLDDGERGERPAAFFFREFCGTLKKARVEVENVARVRFAAGRAAKK